MKALLVGFKSYAGHKENPAELVLEGIDREGVVEVLLDVSYEKVLGITEIIKREKPDYIITMNLSPFRKEPAIEEYAYNEMDSIQPDEEGVVKTKEEIVKGGPHSFVCPLDIPSIQQFVAHHGSNIAISIDPGRFVCNEVSYLARLSGVPTLSLHLPQGKDFPISEQIELVEILLDYFAAI